MNLKLNRKSLIKAIMPTHFTCLYSVFKIKDWRKIVIWDFWEGGGKSLKISPSRWSKQHRIFLGAYITLFTTYWKEKWYIFSCLIRDQMCHKRYSLFFSFGVCGKEQEEKQDKNLFSKYRYSLSNPILAMAHVPSGNPQSYFENIQNCVESVLHSFWYVSEGL